MGRKCVLRLNGSVTLDPYSRGAECDATIKINILQNFRVEKCFFHIRNLIPFSCRAGMFSNEKTEAEKVREFDPSYKLEIGRVGTQIHTH